MPAPSNDELQKAFERLPEPCQAYIMSEKVTDVVDPLADEFGIADKTAFREAIFKMLVLESDASEFLTLAQEKLHLSAEKATHLLAEIGDKILRDLREVYVEAMTRETTVFYSDSALRVTSQHVVLVRSGKEIDIADVDTARPFRRNEDTFASLGCGTVLVIIALASVWGLISINMQGLLWGGFGFFVAGIGLWVLKHQRNWHVVIQLEQGGDPELIMHRSKKNAHTIAVAILEAAIRHGMRTRLDYLIEDVARPQQD